MSFFVPWFLPFVLGAALVSLVLRPRYRWIAMLFASLAFYSVQGLRSLAILLVVLTANLSISGSLLIRRKGALWGLLGLNLGALFVFKYLPWLYHDVFGGIGSLGIVDEGLPLGISFYVFQLTALAVDSHRNNGPILSPHQAGAFTTFFPQLVAGPILRAKDHGAHFLSPKPRGRDVPGALTRILWGIFKKRVVADSLAPIVAVRFANATQLSAPDALAGILAFMLQIYLDFSAYADMAVGIGQLFGIRLPENFDAPYLARSLRDFWRRWHITLSSWLRDYIYIPLGGNRRGPWRTRLNLLATMTIGGLWHGANWTFLIWGILHGAALLGERELSRRKQIPAFISWAATFVVVAVGWAIFRADSLGQAWAVLSSCFRFSRATVEGWSLLAIIIGVFAASVFLQRIRAKSIILRSHPAVKGLVAGLLAALIYFVAATETEFIYWRF